MAIRKGFGRQQKGRRQERRGEQQPVDPVSQAADQMAQFAGEMGLPEGHVQRIKEAGPQAISEWTQEVDESGGVAKIMRMSQQFGNWLEQRMAQGEQPDKSEMERAILELAKKYDVPEDVAKNIMRESLQRVQEVSARQQGQQEQQGQQGGTNGNQRRV